MEPFTVKNSYNVDHKTNVPFEKRDSSPDTEMPGPSVNGGLYGGPQSSKPWMPIPVTPTATNYIMNHLKSANPPPGAIEQYVGQIRLGNNYTAMPGVKWWVPKKSNCGPYSITGLDNTNNETTLTTKQH